MTFPTRSLLPLATAALLLSSTQAHAQAVDAATARALRPSVVEIDAQPANLGGGLRQLAAAAGRGTAVVGGEPQRRAAALVAHRRATVPRAQADADGRVVVDVRLDGRAPAAETRAALETLGATVFSESAGFHGHAGILGLYLPPERAAEAARLPGVHSVNLVHRPWRRVGRTTSQGTAVLRTDAVNARGFTGRGITVGVLSDSYDVTTPHASADIRSDDLPGVGNPAGRTTPVFVLAEGDKNDPFYADEGRGMLQIIHDVAPDATLAFATIGATQATFANNIHRLRTDARAHCDVLVDDIGFPDEPFFSDSVVARAVEDVVNSGALYYSAAGNDADLAYEADFLPISDAEARAGRGVGNLKLDQVPAFLTADGFHDFARTDGGTDAAIAQRVTVSVDLAELDFQWNDAFGPGRATADYNLLVFDADGNYLPDLSGTDDAFSTGDALEIVDLDVPADGTERVYQLAIARRAGGSGQATHFRYLAHTFGNFISQYLRPNTPTVFGHAVAHGADAVAAYAYDTPTLFESANSFGPVRIDFDANGNRLPTPEIRLQPTVAATDGVNTTFFPPNPGADFDGDGFPNFFGTSAAAPHAAGVAALLLQAGGGPGSLNAGQVRDLLTSTAAPHDLDPFAVSARLGSVDGGMVVSLTAAGNDSNNAAFDKRFFTLRYEAGPAGTSLKSLNIDLGPAKERFDSSADLGLPFGVGLALGISATSVTATVSSVPDAPSENTKLTLNFLPGTFVPGATLSFGIDRDTSAGSGGNNADLLAGATLKVKVANPGATKSKLNGTFQNNFGAGYSPADGFGLINAEAALNRLGR